MAVEHEKRRIHRIPRPGTLKLMPTNLLQRLRRRYHPLWRLRRWVPYRRLQRALDFAITTRVGRVTRYSYFFRDFPGLLFGTQSEPRSEQLLTRLFGLVPITCFVDVGANVGNYSWIVANEQPQVKLIMFEPDAKNVWLLRRSIERSGLTNALLYPVAIADVHGIARFIVDDVSGAVGSIVDQRGQIYNLQDSYRLMQEETIETRTLDEFLPQLSGECVLLKIDVEGAEALVFQGATRVLSEVRPIILFESFARDGFATLRAARYRVYSTEENSNYLAFPEELDRIMTQFDLRNACIPCA